jgi:DNA-binding LytR/AlgR family response regulator
MKIVICDDNQNFSQLLYSKIANYFAGIDKHFQCEVFLAPKSLLAADLTSTHALFLDVDMPGMNGIDVARKLRAVYPDIFIVFVTGWTEYAPAGYCVNAFRYLLKQRLDEELFQCLDDIREKLARSQERIQLYGREYAFEMALNDINYFEGSPYRMVQLHPIAGNTIECRGKLSELEKTLEGKGFLRIQKSFIVNMHHVLQIKGYKAFLRDGTALKTTERNYSQICKQYLVWKGQQL